MANEVLLKSGTPLTATMTSLTSLATSTTTGAAQSAKVDLGATRAQQMLVRLQTKFATAPTAGRALEVYVGFSSSSVSSTGNTALLTGADAGWTGYNSDISYAKRQLTFVGLLSAANVSTVQTADVGSFTPADRYAQIVVVNTADQALASTSADHVVTILPIVDEVQ